MSGADNALISSPSLTDQIEIISLSLNDATINNRAWQGIWELVVRPKTEQSLVDSLVDQKDHKFNVFLKSKFLECSLHLRHLIIEYNWLLRITNTISIHNNPMRVHLVLIPELSYGFKHNLFEGIWYLLALILYLGYGPILGCPLIHASGYSQYRAFPPAHFVIYIESAYHGRFIEIREVTHCPGLPPDFGTYLYEYLVAYRPNILPLGDGIWQYDLWGHGYLCEKQSLYIIIERGLFLLARENKYNGLHTAI